MIRLATLLLTVACVSNTTVDAQKAADTTYVVVSASASPGASMNSAVYQTAAATGEGVVTGASSSPNYEVTGGYVASFTVDVSTRPALIAVLPRYNDLNKQETIVLGGTGLNLSTITGITIGGIPAVRGQSNVAWILSQLPKQVEPGYLPVEVVGSFGKTTLPEAIGIRPLIEVTSPPPRYQAFSIFVRGTQNDQVVLAASLGKIPGFVLPPFRHLFLLDPTLMIILPPRTITDPSGVLTYTFPPIPLPATTKYSLQALVQSSASSYAPGTFTNIRTF